MSDALYQKEIHLATHLRHSPQDTYMVSLSKRLEEIKTEFEKTQTTSYRERLMKEQQEIFRKLDLSSEIGIINRIGTLANLQNPYII